MERNESGAVSLTAEGISAMTTGLMAEFPPEAHKQRQGGGGRQFTYVETHAYCHRLIDVTNNRYDWRINTFSIEGGVAIVTGTLTIPGLGSRDGIGVQAIMPGKAGQEDLLKGASSDAIKAAAKLFGVALYLYGPDYEGDEDVLDGGHVPSAPKQSPSQGKAPAPNNPLPPLPPRPLGKTDPPGKFVPAKSKTPDPPPPTPEEKALKAARLKFRDEVWRFFPGLASDSIVALFRWVSGVKEGSLDDVCEAQWTDAMGNLAAPLSTLKTTAVKVKRKEITFAEAMPIATGEGCSQSLFLVLSQAVKDEEGQ